MSAMTPDQNAKARDPFAEVNKKEWLANLQSGAKWQFYCTQFQIATQMRPQYGNLA
jgi:hypothetical protein